MKILAFSAILAVSATALQGQFLISGSYGWEDGSGTILGSFNDISDPANVGTTGGVTPFEGERMLTFNSDEAGGRPQAYLAYIENLSEGDLIRASFRGWDSTDGSNPSPRIWAHYADPGDVTSFRGSAGGPDFVDGTGWLEFSNDWVFDEQTPGFPPRNAFIIELRTYTEDGVSSPFYADLIQVDVVTTNPNAKITFPDGSMVFIPEPSALSLFALGGVALLALLRRRR